MADGAKVIALNGSPHCDGNTATLMQWIADGCREAGAKVEWIDIAGADVGFCLGCGACLREGRCIVEDGFARLYDQLLDTRGVIVGSPVYEGQMTAQLKAVCDRLAQLNLYAGVLEGHWAVGAATSGLAPARPLARQLAGLFGRSSGAVSARTVTLRDGPRPLATTQRPHLERRARRAGRRLVRDIEHGRAIAPFKSVWIRFLRHRLLARLVRRYPERFAAVLRIWEGEAD